MNLSKPVPQPQNVNDLKRQELSSLNQKIAVLITKSVGSMWCAYIFIALAITGFPGFHATLPQYVQWFSQTFLQLVFLPVLAVGQGVLNRSQELQSEETYRTTVDIVGYLLDHDDELVKQSDILTKLLHMFGTPEEAEIAMKNYAEFKREHDAFHEIVQKKRKTRQISP